MTRPGWVRMKAGRAGAKIWPPKPSDTLIRTVPVTPPDPSVSLAVSMAVSTDRPASRNRAPAAVSCSPLGERTKRVDFRLASSRCIRRPTVVGSMCKRKAAPASEPLRAAAIKTRRSSQSFMEQA